MKKSELKSLLKPLIRECIRECIFEEGVLSGIITEVTKGLTSNIIVESKTTSKSIPETPRKEKKRTSNSVLTAQRKKLMDAIGVDAYQGVNLFEGTTPMTSHQSPQTQATNPLNGVSPNDAGVDISGIFGLAGKKWNRLK